MAVRKRLSDAMHEEEAEDLHDLVDRAAKGDTDAFRELFERYHDRVYRYAYARLRDPEEAQDALQDVFLAAWRGLPEFRCEHEGSFPAWLFGIARHVVGTHHRKRSRTPSLSLEAPPDGEVEFEGQTVSSRMLAEELARLPESQREVLILRFLTGLSAHEIATALGKSEGAVSALQVRGLRRLARQIERER